jgi:hypothetical protein
VSFAVIAIEGQVACDSPKAPVDEVHGSYNQLLHVDKMVGDGEAASQIVEDVISVREKRSW